MCCFICVCFSLYSLIMAYLLLHCFFSPRHLHALFPLINNVPVVHVLISPQSSSCSHYLVAATACMCGCECLLFLQHDSRSTFLRFLSCFFVLLFVNGALRRHKNKI
eukprot:m.125269 g.125269  ORF g.125269 m.125269 type:complete len:107 (+) comp13795_c0_seq2:14144-14464(+)